MRAKSLTGQTTDQLKALSTAYATLQTGTSAKDQKVLLHANNSGSSTRLVSVRLGGAGGVAVHQLAAYETRTIFDGMIYGTTIIEAKQDSGADIMCWGEFREL